MRLHAPACICISTDSEAQQDTDVFERYSCQKTTRRIWTMQMTKFAKQELSPEDCEAVLESAISSCGAPTTGTTLLSIHPMQVRMLACDSADLLRDMATDQSVTFHKLRHD